MYRNRVKNDKNFFLRYPKFLLVNKRKSRVGKFKIIFSITQIPNLSLELRIKKRVTFRTKCDPFLVLLTLYSSTLSKYNSWSSKNLTLVENAKSTIIVITGFLLGNFRLFPFPATNCSTMEFLRIPPLALTSSSSISFSDSSSLLSSPPFWSSS